MDIHKYLVTLIHVALLVPSQTKRDKEETKNWNNEICYGNNFKTIGKLLDITLQSFLAVASNSD